MAKILGLDLGTNSIGWAVVEKNRNEEFKLLKKGVRIFQEGVKIEKGNEKSRAAERTDYRSARRIKYRRKLRKIETLKVLSDFGYCPKLSIEELDNWRYKKIYPENKHFRDWWLTDEKTKKTPYYYRYLGVTKKLDLTQEGNKFILGRAFYHIAQRRGFLSNRLENTKESDGAVNKSIDGINKVKGKKTIGQYFYEKYQKGEKIRDTYTHREKHYLDEVNRICEFQKLPNKFVEKLENAIFYQRPLKSQKGLVAKCVFETNKPRCPVSRPEFEEYRMLCFVNNIKIKTPDDDKLRFLNKTEKEKILPLFFRKSKPHFDFEEIAKQLAPKKQYTFYKNKEKLNDYWLFNYKMNTTVSGCPVSARLKDLFGEEYINIKFDYIRIKDTKSSFIDINDIWHVLFTFDRDEKIIEFSKKRLGLNDDQIKELLKIKLKKEYASLSLKAIKKILPYLREGLIYSHAVFLANMEEVIPKEIWNDEKNKQIISNEIFNIIQIQNEKKLVANVINGMIKICREEQSSWSLEAEDIYKNEIHAKLLSVFGENRFASFSSEKKEKLEKNTFEKFKQQIQKNQGKGEFIQMQTIIDRVKEFISDNFNPDESKLDKIYHPSAVEVYKLPVKKDDGKYYLNSPVVSSIRNPMAMRALHQLRKVINELIRNDIIDPSTKVHIEMARDLMNANERKAYQAWQREKENLRKEYVIRIKEYFGNNYEPSETEILKYQFWEEQNHHCIYTGKEIGLCDFLNPNPKFDIEHTIPRSISFNNSQENKTLCDNFFNRSVKKNKIPFQLGESKWHEILNVIEPWKEKYEELEKQIQVVIRQSKVAVDKDSKDRAIQKKHKLSYEKKYWRNKYNYFAMKDVPEGFKNSQLVDTGIITKYSRLYLNTLFDNVYTVKGNTVSDFRKMWGLQDEFEKKERVNHIHHCIDAITIACITKENYEILAKFYHDWEELYAKGVNQLPPVEKPWKTFTEDIKGIENEILVSHHTPDVLPKQSKYKFKKHKKIQRDKNGNIIYQKGDTVRGSLHQDGIYGAIVKNDSIVYVKRKPLQFDAQGSNGFKDLKQLDNIVDIGIRNVILNQISEKIKEGKSFKEAISEDLWMNEEKGIKINKVRCITNVKNPLEWEKKNRDLSETKNYKHKVHVINDGNYSMAIYEGKDSNGKLKRDFEIKNNQKAGQFFKLSVKNNLKPQNLFPTFKINGKIELPFKALIKIGTMVILCENNPEEVWVSSLLERKKRLYKIVGISTNRVKSGNKYYEFGNIVLRHHQEARPASELKVQDGEYKIDEDYIAQRKLSHNQFNALIEGVDFKLSPLGEIAPINNI